MRKGSKGTKRKRGLLLPAAFAACLGLMCLVPGIHARYQSADYGGVRARVAAFQVSAGSAELLSSDSTAESPEDRVSYRIRLQNDSECEIFYEVAIVNASGRKVEWTLSGSTGKLAAGESRTVEVSLSIPEEVFRGLTQSADINGLRAEVSFTQAEPGGAL